MLDKSVGHHQTSFVMSIRIATEDDIQGILSLQSQNLYSNLAADELPGGFVMTPFTPDLICQVLKQSGVFVAEIDRQTVGYLIAADWDFFSQWEIFRLMVARLPALEFQGRKIEIEQSFQYGPICIDKSYRGSNILPDLFTIMKDEFSPKTGVTFINKLNQRSLLAHKNKLNFEIIDEFEFNHHSFYTLAFQTQPDLSR